MTPERMSDKVIDDWIREELDAVPRPERALRSALAASLNTPQEHGWRHRLRRLLGAVSTTAGSSDHPEVVLRPPVASFGGGPSGGDSVLHCESHAQQLVVVLVVLLGLGMTIWFAFSPGGPAGSFLAAPAGTAVPEQPRIELPPPDATGRQIRVGSSDAAHFRTIAGAVATAVDGDRVTLEPGTYLAQVTIDKDIVISGEGAREDVIVEPLPLPAGTTEEELSRDVFYLESSNATLDGFTVRGAEHGTSISIDGGSPTVRDMVIDPRPGFGRGTPTRPRHAVVIDGGSSATIKDTHSTGFVWISGGSIPRLEGVDIVGSCIFIEGRDTDPVIEGVRIEASACPLFTISVSGGAGPTMTTVNITNSEDTTGIRIVGEGTTSFINGSTIDGGPVGISIGPGSEVTVQATKVEGAETGIAVQDATADLDRTRLYQNGVGLRVEGDSRLETKDNDICENGRNLALTDGVQVSPDHNDICADGTTTS